VLGAIGIVFTAAVCVRLPSSCPGRARRNKSNLAACCRCSVSAYFISLGATHFWVTFQTPCVSPREEQDTLAFFALMPDERRRSCSTNARSMWRNWPVAGESAYSACPLALGGLFSVRTTLCLVLCRAFLLNAHRAGALPFGRLLPGAVCHIILIALLALSCLSILRPGLAGDVCFLSDAAV